MKKNKSTFEAVIGLAIASIAVGYTSKKEALIECLKQWIAREESKGAKNG